MPLQFDIRAILKEKAPKARVPDCLIRYLERITHVNQMNAFLRKHTTETDYDFIRVVLDEELGCTASIEGIENIPTDGKPVIFVSNHPLGGLDGMIIAQMIHESRAEKRELKVIVNDLLMYMKPLAGLWAPVSKLGRFSKHNNGCGSRKRMYSPSLPALAADSNALTANGKLKTWNGRKTSSSGHANTNAMLSRSISREETVISSISSPSSANCYGSRSISRCYTSWTRCTAHMANISRSMSCRQSHTPTWIAPARLKNGRNMSNPSYIPKTEY